MLRIITEHLPNTAIIRCYGRIVAGNESESFRDAVACEADKRLVMVDLASVAAIDARGLGVLVFLHTLGYTLGFHLQFMNPAPRVWEVLDLTRLNSVLEITHMETRERELSGPAAA